MKEEYKQVLKKYGISLTKQNTSLKEMRSSDYLSTFISLWESSENIDEFVDDINRCLAGNFNSIEDPDWSIHTFHAELTPTGLKVYDVNDQNVITGFDVFPLVDIKNLLLVWKEF
ncbi:hypothetical protein [Chryseobacterium sp. MP_3.2]|uniref:hypothetical protein n=1 Tax=Chryseobacterium sp. MP_3.2 TaxID=3071712 RepID=UPI002E03FC7D|nr:hypothetical protein [Chryseobacterium sp. MP_3.2]